MGFIIWANFAETCCTRRKESWTRVWRAAQQWRLATSRCAIFIAGRGWARLDIIPSGCVRVRPSFIGLLYYYFHWKTPLCMAYTSSATTAAFVADSGIQMHEPILCGYTILLVRFLCVCMCFFVLLDCLGYLFLLGLIVIVLVFLRLVY